MSEDTSQRDERSAQLVDDPDEQVDELDQDSAEDQVSDRDYDGAADSATTDGDDSVVDARAQASEVDGGVASEVAADDVVDVSVASDDVGADIVDNHDELMPGEADAAPVASVWNSEAAAGLRDRWQELQLRFVDDPRGVVAEAQALVAEAVQDLTAALTDKQTELDGWAAGGIGDTEQLRVALQRYREFFDRVLAHG